MKYIYVDVGNGKNGMVTEGDSLPWPFIKLPNPRSSARAPQKHAIFGGTRSVGQENVPDMDRSGMGLCHATCFVAMDAEKQLKKDIGELVTVNVESKQQRVFGLHNKYVINSQQSIKY